MPGIFRHVAATRSNRILWIMSIIGTIDDVGSNVSSARYRPFANLRIRTRSLFVSDEDDLTIRSVRRVQRSANVSAMYQSTRQFGKEDI